MKIPEFIKIGYKVYRIEECEPKLTIEDYYGTIEYNDEKIYLRNSNSEEQNEQTLLHEVLHGVSEFYLLGMDEKQVTLLANALFTVLKDNNLEIKERPYDE